MAADNMICLQKRHGRWYKAKRPRMALEHGRSCWQMTNKHDRVRGNGKCQVEVRHGRVGMGHLAGCEPHLGALSSLQ
jgi:hypothetical protein